VKLSLVFKTALFVLIVFFQQKRGVKLCIFGKNAELHSLFWQKRRVTFIVLAKTQSKTMRFWLYTSYSEKKQNYAFLANMLSETKVSPENSA
jgi:hypothetical protein